MYITANYDVTMNGSKVDTLAIASLLAAKLNDAALNGKTELHIEDDKLFVELESIEALAVEMAKVAGTATFIMKGYIDESAAAGEFMNCEITFEGGKLISKSSDWYTDMDAADYDDYDEFCENYYNDDDEPLYTEEQYEAFCDGEWFALENSNHDVVSEVPLTHVSELTVG